MDLPSTFLMVLIAFRPSCPLGLADQRKAKKLILSVLCGAVNYYLKSKHSMRRSKIWL
jgi:hypothetical protein